MGKEKKNDKEASAEKVEAPLSLVTGACGFMGTHMVEILHQAGHRIRATDLASAYEKDDYEKGRFPSVLKKLNVEFIPADLRDSRTLKPLVKGVDYVFHIGAVFSYSAPWELLYQVNVEGTRHLCEYLLMEKGDLKRFVLWGAGGIYGFPSIKEMPLRENSPKNPPNNYLKSKWMQEQLVMEMHQNKGLPYSSVRPTTVYGPRAVYGGGQLLMSAAKMKVIAIPINWTARIPFVHVRDVCNAALYIATHPKANGKAFNLNDDSQLTYVEYFKFVAKVMGVPFIPLPPVPILPLRLALYNIARITEFISRNLYDLNLGLEADSVNYLGRDIFYSNEELKKIGYVFLYPDARKGIEETLHWYHENGWI